MRQIQARHGLDEVNVAMGCDRHSNRRTRVPGDEESPYPGRHWTRSFLEFGLQEHQRA